MFTDSVTCQLPEQSEMSNTLPFYVDFDSSKQPTKIGTPQPSLENLDPSFQQPVDLSAYINNGVGEVLDFFQSGANNSAPAQVPATVQQVELQSQLQFMQPNLEFTPLTSRIAIKEERADTFTSLLNGTNFNLHDADSNHSTGASILSFFTFSTLQILK